MQDPQAAPDWLDRFGATMNPGLARVLRFMGLDEVEVTGSGAELIDHAGRRFLDCSGGYGVFLHGYRHPRLVEAARRQLDQLAMSSRVLLNPRTIELAELLAEVAPGDLQYSFFTNSGTESVEAALKFARAATGRSRFISTWGAFHGKSMGALAVSGRALYQDPFRPLIGDVTHVAYGSLEELASTLADDVAAVILEPIQGEGGVIVPPPGYLAGARRLTEQHGALLIADEVQTGLGRTGDLFAVNHEHVVPDLLCLSKALSGGIVPVGAVIGRPGVWEFFSEAPLIHTSTFGGNPLATAVAAEAIRVVREEDLVGQARAKGAWLLPALQEVARRYPTVLREVRGRGLMIGMETATAGVGGALMSELFHRGVVAVYTYNNERVLRLLPPLVIRPDQLEQVVERLDQAARAVAAMHLEEVGHAAR